jgi:uncharacterized cysteine cluster protein YcgN (CxxCxxCC family)
VTEWWNTTPLAQLDAGQWEALCDGCAKCCLHKLEDEDTGEVFYTRVRCRYLNEDSCSCSDYDNRSVLVPNCIRLEQGNVAEPYMRWGCLSGGGQYQMNMCIPTGTMSTSCTGWNRR